MTNAEKSYRAGVEIGSKIRLSRNTEWNNGFTLSRNRIPGFSAWYLDYNTSDWSFQYKNIELGTVDIAYSPSFTAFSDLSFTLPGKIGIRLVSKYVGKQYFDNTMSELRKIDAYFVNNLVVSSNLLTEKIQKLEMKLYVNNVFNSLYSSNAYGGIWYEDGIEKTWAYYFPQATANIAFSVDIKF
jgi:iron complex outermembrane receptor protein